MNKKMTVLITMGDAAGIGAEITVKALGHRAIYDACTPVVIGDRAALEEALAFCGLEMRLHGVEDVEEALGMPGTLDFLDMGILKKGGWEYKKNSGACGKASFAYVVKAIELAMTGKASAVVTAPISKESLRLADIHYDGHTEIFARYTNTEDYAMLLAGGGLHVIHVSAHCSLLEACRRVKKERVYEVIRLAQRGMRELGYESPRIAVAGLNPHSSENGLFGDEEEKEIIPAIKKAAEEGICVTGPEPPDTVFVKCRGGQYDIVVAMYHDQGHIPLKLDGFLYDREKNRYESISGINCTIGLPIVRTSVDHGTAFGKAGEGRANEESMLDAIFAGVKMAENRGKNNG